MTSYEKHETQVACIICGTEIPIGKCPAICSDRCRELFNYECRFNTWAKKQTASGKLVDDYFDGRPPKTKDIHSDCIPKSDLRKLVEEIRKGRHVNDQEAAYGDCADKIEKLLDGGGE